MLPNERFENLDLEFWANIKLLNQRLGYTERKTRKNPNPGFVIPTVAQIVAVYRAEDLDVSRLVFQDELTEMGILVCDYMRYRGAALTHNVEPSLMNRDEAKRVFEELRIRLDPGCPLPLNKQTGDKKDFAFLTGLVNMLIEANKGEACCDYDPRELTAFTLNGFPARVLSRRVDGAFPSIVNPTAIWEIKEYYYTTTFGSRVADGVYETQLDGLELREVEEYTQNSVQHYLIVDDRYTWWVKGKSYLCRLIDMMHMGLVTEVIFGREVLQRIPALVTSWVQQD